MNIDWIAEDDTSTIGHASKLELNGTTIYSPVHLLSAREISIAEKHRQTPELGNTDVCIAGKPLSYKEYKGIGKDPAVMEGVAEDIGKKMVKGKTNIVFPRIPSGHTVNDARVEVKSLDDFQASGIVNIQLELKSSVIIPPMYTNISSEKQAMAIYNRTKTEVQTFNTKSEVMGYIPTTPDLELVGNIIKAYIKDGIRFFGVDFSSSPINRWLLRNVLSHIRRSLRINGKVGEKKDKNFYLHVFDIPSNQRSVSDVSSITDIIAHPYGVDSTSGVIWGGGKMVKDNLRLFDFSTYGAVRVKALDSTGINYNKTLVSGSTQEVYEKLRTKKNVDYNLESKRIVSLLSTKQNAYGGYLLTKTNATERVNDALMDIREIKSYT